MAILVNFSAGETSVKTSSLHQWDYGQQLEIHSDDLPSLIEVHFACQGMNEAVVHSCSAKNGVAMVDIPNRCLEQTNPITAWVYEIDGTKGTTTKTITIPIIARVRPGKSAEIPQDVSDQYTDLITEVNRAIEKLKSGEVVIDHATHATSADTAATAGNASSATYATSAGNAASASRAAEANTALKATHAEYAVKAGTDGDGDEITSKYAFFPYDFTSYDRVTALSEGTYQVKVFLSNKYRYAILTYTEGEESLASLGGTQGKIDEHYVINCSSTGLLTVQLSGSTTLTLDVAVPIYYRKISLN